MSKQKEKVFDQVLKKKRNELIVKLADQCFSLSDIARIFNISHTTVMRILDKKNGTL